MSEKVFVGVDGYIAGWFAVFLAAEKEKSCEWKGFSINLVIS